MKESTVIVLIVAGVAALFWAMSRGLLGVGVGPTGLVANPATGHLAGAITVPQPTQNYSGYLAASTAPGVASALNSIFGGIGSSISGWLSPSGSSNTPYVNQGPIAPSPEAPSAAAQPGGPLPDGFFSGASQNPVVASSAFVGPVVAPDLAYGATSGLAFAYDGLAADNAPDMSYSLEQTS